MVATFVRGHLHLSFIAHCTGLKGITVDTNALGATIPQLPNTYTDAVVAMFSCRI